MYIYTLKLDKKEQKGQKIPNAKKKKKYQRTGTRCYVQSKKYDK